MRDITVEDIRRALRNENPWWELGRPISAYRGLPKRIPFDEIYHFWRGKRARAIVLYGPRRVGKTVILQQCVEAALTDGTAPTDILYVAGDNPAYGFTSLQRIMDIFREDFGHAREKRLYVLIDEIQYLRDWERHLKLLVDTFRHCRFIASGSAAAALRRKSRESGAGRFTDWPLPPLTFPEYLDLSKKGHLDIDWKEETIGSATSGDMAVLNAHFIDYLNFGGFPEIVSNPDMESSITRHIGSDIIDKVLLKDLPSLYGIDDPSELQRFFSMLALNTGQELRLDDLSQASGLAKNTIKKYLEFLEAAFLVKRVFRIDQSSRTMKRQTHFKAYVTSPSLRAAIWGPVAAEETAVLGHLIETAVANHLLTEHVRGVVAYLRDDEGEVDFITLPGSLGQRKPLAVREVKWSDRAFAAPERELGRLLAYCRTNKVNRAEVLTKSSDGSKSVGEIDIKFTPVARFCILEAQVAWLSSRRSHRDG